MPIYQYLCVKCGEVTDKVRSIANRDVPIQCVCGGEALPIVTKPGRFQRSPGWASRVDTPMPGRIEE